MNMTANMWKRLRAAAALLAVVLLLTMLPVAAEDAAQATVYSGRAALAQEESRAEALTYAYDCLAEGLLAAQEEISIHSDDRLITVAELETVMTAVLSDHPEIFWMGSTYSYSWDGTYVFAVLPQYVFTGEALESAKAEVEQAVQTLTAGLEGKSDYEISLLLHDRLIAHVTYEFAEHNQTLYGALVDREAVCNGYAAAYQYLLGRMGIPAWKVDGASIDPNSGNTVSHAWDLVCLDGAWYYTDPTWDDQAEAGHPFYEYLNITTAQMREQHALSAFFAANVPECTATAANYYTVHSGQKLAAFDAAAVAQAMTARTVPLASFYVTGDVDAFLRGWTEQVMAVAGKVGISGQFYYSYEQLSHEVVLSLRTENTVGGRLKAHAHAEDVTLELTKWGTTAPAHTALLEAATGDVDYALPAVLSGDYTLKVTKPGCLPAEYAVAVGVQDVQMDLHLTLIGDMTGDDVITAKDAIYTLYHVLLPSMYPASQPVDFNRNGVSDSADAVYLLYHSLIPGSYPLY